MASPTPASVLLPYQQRWISDDSQLKIAEKSRRTGITWAEAADATLSAAADKKAGGTNHFYVGSNKEMAREFIDAVAMWAKAFDKVASAVQEELFADDSGREILTFVVYFSNSGFKIQALSSNPKNLRGMQGNVTIDEAAFHERLAEVLKAALALTMWGAKVRLISTHNGVDNLFNELIQQSRAGKKRYSVHRITLDDALADGLYKRICLVSGKAWTPQLQQTWRDGLLKDTATEEDALEEYFCVPKASSGSYLSRMLIESCMSDKWQVLRFEGSAAFNESPEPQRNAVIDDWCQQQLMPCLTELKPNLQHCFGEDFGRSGDLTVIAPFEIGQDLKRRCPFIVELRNVPFRNQEQVLFFIADHLPRLMGGKLDSRGNGQYLAEQARYRYGSGIIDAVMLSQSWYLEHMPPFKAAFEDLDIELPQDADILSDLQAIQVIKGIPKLPDGNTVKVSGKQPRHGDAAVALCLAWAASRMEGGQIEYTALPSKSERSDPDHDYYYERGCF